MNVVLIECDQLSARWLGCYGSQAAHTPNLDRLAADGARFDNCFANLPVCMPSRASTITGRSAHHHGVFYNSWELGTDLATFPQVLQRNGFRTLGVGKFHLECHGRSSYNDVTKYGFDRAETTEDIRSGLWLDWVERTYPEHYERALATVWGFDHLADYGGTGRDLRPAVAAAKKKYPPKPRAPISYPSIVPEEACQTRWNVDRAIAFLDERDKGRPFYLKVSFVDPHAPYDPPERFLDFIDPDSVPPPVHSDDDALHQAIARFDDVKFVGRFRDMTTEDWRTMRWHYFASIAFVDEQVGRLRAYLEAQGLAEDTVILLTADHGDMMGDHGLPTKGAWHFDACMRVPFIVAGPGIPPGTVQDRVVTNLDLFPTIVDFADAEHDAPVEGRSLRGLLAGADDLDRPDAALIETYGSYADTDRHLWARTVATPDARFTLFGDGSGMLFDMASDPHETTNLFGQPSTRATEGRMKDLMLELLDRQNLPLPARNRHPTALH